MKKKKRITTEKQKTSSSIMDSFETIGKIYISLQNISQENMAILTLKIPD